MNNQAYIFLIFILNGFLIGIFFDIFRILRKSFETPDIITYIEDITFWILTGFTSLFTIFKFNNGEVRLYIFLGILIGLIMYILLFSKVFIKISVKIILFIKKIFHTVFILPIKFIIGILRKILIRPISFVFINLRKILFNFGKKIVKIRRIKRK